jgi:hypothetical protein
MLEENGMSMNDKRRVTKDGILTIDDAGMVLLQVQGLQDSQDVVSVPLSEILKNFVGGAIVLDVNGTRHDGRLECNDGNILSIMQKSKKRLLVARIMEALTDKHVILDVRAGMTSTITIHEA